MVGLRGVYFPMLAVLPIGFVRRHREERLDKMCLLMVVDLPRAPLAEVNAGLAFTVTFFFTFFFETELPLVAKFALFDDTGV